MVLPIASVCSTHPPVSVCGTGPVGLPRGFSRQRGITGFGIGLRPRPQAHMGCVLHNIPPYGASRGRPEPRPATLLRRPIGDSALRGCGNVCPLRIGYAFRPRLSPRLTLGGLALPRKPRVHGGRVTLSSLATHASILTPMRSTVGRPPASPPMGSSPTDSKYLKSRRFGVQLSPVYCRRMSTRPVSCYALFEWVAASKPTSWLSGRTHILCHSTWNWGP